MSLQSTIHKLNTDLISLFAMVDAWLDRGDYFLDFKGTLFSSKRTIIVDFIVVNKQVLEFVNKISGDDAEDNFCFEVIDAYNKVTDILRSETEFQKYLEANADVLRDVTREQLFQLLCLIDALHDKRLDVTYAMVHPQHAAGLKTIRELITATEQKLRMHQQEVEWN
jgi:hypothetical protein